LNLKKIILCFLTTFFYTNSLDNQDLEEFEFFREIGPRKYIIVTKTGEIGFGAAAYNKFVERRNYLCNLTTAYNIFKRTIQVLPLVGKLKEFKIQLGIGRSGQLHGYWLKGSWYECEFFVFLILFIFLNDI